MSDAYREWYRILKKGGLLLNFDGNYGRRMKKKRSSFLKSMPTRTCGRI